MRRITYTVEVVRENVVKINLSFNGFRVDVLEVLILRGHDRRKAARAKGFTQLLHQADLVGLVDSRIAATGLSARPLPVDVDSPKVPLAQELEK